MSSTTASKIRIFLLGCVGTSFYRVASGTIDHGYCGVDGNDTDDEQDRRACVVVGRDCGGSGDGIFDAVVNVHCDFGWRTNRIEKGSSKPKTARDSRVAIS